MTQPSPISPMKKQPDVSHQTSQNQVLDNITKYYEREGPVDAATRFSLLADQQERAKNLEGAIISNQKANEQYLKAMAMIKQQHGFDPEAIKSLEILAETHRRKAKLLQMRLHVGVDSVREKLDQMMLTKKQNKRKNVKGNNPGVNNLNNEVAQKQNDQDKQNEKLMEMMKQKMIIVNASMFNESKKALEILVEYQKTKLEKFEIKFAEILQIFRKSFNEQTRDVILSYGEKFVSVHSNPFAKDALKESINIGKIERNNQKFEQFIEALKKYRSLMDEKMTKIVNKIDQISTKDQSFEMNYGQLAALATSPMGKNIGLENLFMDKQEQLAPFFQAMKQKEAMHELDQSVMRVEKAGFEQSQMFSQFASPMSNINQNPLMNMNMNGGFNDKGLMEQMKEIDSLKAQVKTLVEENQTLRKKLDKYKKYCLKLAPIDQIQRKKRDSVGSKDNQ